MWNVSRSGRFVRSARTLIGIRCIARFVCTVTISDLMALFRHLVGQRRVNSVTVCPLDVSKLEAALESRALVTCDILIVKMCTVYVCGFCIWQLL